MSKITVEESNLSAIADSIRSKGGTNGSLIFPEGFVSAINGIKTDNIPDGYIDKTKINHFATGVVNNVTAGQKLTVTGIKDSKTGEAFVVKGLVAFVEPSATQNYSSSTNGKPAIVMFYRDTTTGTGVAIACYGTAYTVRANTDFKNNEYIVINNNSFYFIQKTDTMWGVMAAVKWRWVAWG